MNFYNHSMYLTSVLHKKKNQVTWHLLCGNLIDVHVFSYTCNEDLYLQLILNFCS